ncbi:MAG: carboxypeptidase regulatory-like domain-containing protein, partial [Oscillospiraceae bacterium]
QSTTTFNSLIAGTEYKFYTRVKESDKHLAGTESAATTIKTDKSVYAGTQATAPNATNSTKTDTTVTLDVQTIAGEALEYGYSTTVDGTITWQDSNVFTKLAANTDYYFFARVKETNTHAAGTTITGTQIKTDKVDYTGIETTAPEKAPASKTKTSITLKTVTLPTGEPVEYGIYKNGKIEWQLTPTFDGLTVGTEYKFYTRVKESDTHKAGATSAATTITTQKANATVGGKVTLSGGTALDGATVTLTPSDPLLTTTTNSSGVYTFTDVPEGVYSLVITKGTGTNEITITDTVIVAGTTIGNKDITFPDASKNTVVVSSDPKAPVAVSGMNDLLNTTNIGHTLTPSEKDAVDKGGSVDLTFTATSDAANDKEKLEALAATKGQTIDMLLDLSVKKIVKNLNDEVIADEPIHSLATIIEVNIPIKPELQGKADLTLYRVHGPVAEPLPKDEINKNSDGEYYTIDPSKTFMTAYVKNFSSYGIGFTAYEVTITDGGTGASGSGKYSDGAIVTINAGSKSGYTFDSWTVTAGGVTLVNANSATTSFNMPATAVTVKANWTYTGGGTGGNPSPEVYYYINATTSKGGSINTPERVKVIAGGYAGFVITPDKGYQLVDVLINGKSIGAEHYYAFTNVNSDQTIHATFKKAGHRNPQTGVDANVD